MKRLLIWTAVSVVCFVLNAGVSSAKKKPEMPIQERFEATLNPFMGDAHTVTIAIAEFSTDEEVEELAQKFSKGGEDGLEDATQKLKKGYYELENLDLRPIRVIRTNSAGGVRRITIVGEASDATHGAGGGFARIGHRGYPFIFFEIDVNEQGNGKGVIVPFARLTFDDQGKMHIKPMSVGTRSGSTGNLVNVHRVK